jgi:hypothetical protein
MIQLYSENELATFTAKLENEKRGKIGPLGELSRIYLAVASTYGCRLPWKVVKFQLDRLGVQPTEDENMPGLFWLDLEPVRDLIAAENEIADETDWIEATE